jgi:hypothetical protein
VSNAREKKLKATTASRQAAALVPLQMAFWSDERRAVSNELARSAIWSRRDIRTKRAYYDNIGLFMLGEGSVTYKGEELRTNDEDIFVSLAHFSRDLPSGKLIVRTTSSDICKLNGWRQSQHYYDQIFLSIQRMKGGVITVFSRRIAQAIKCQRALADGASDETLARLYDELNAVEKAALASNGQVSGDAEMGGMMLNLIAGEPTMTGAKGLKKNIPQGNLQWEIHLDKNLVTLFAKPYLTIIEARARAQLADAGKGLQAYFASHREPYPVKLRSLEKLLSLNIKDLSALKQNIKGHLETMKRIGVIEDFSFSRSADKSDWLVSVTRPSAAQNDL